MKKIIYFLLFFLYFSTLLAFKWSDVGDCEPVFLKLSFSTEDASHSMGISWMTKKQCQTEVLFTKKGTASQKKVQGIIVEGNAGLGFNHKVTILNLFPDTEYEYVAGGGSLWSQKHTFKTAPSKNTCKSFAFVVASDSRADQVYGDDVGATEAWTKIMSEAMSNDRNGISPAFLFNGGDLVVDGDKNLQWLSFLEKTPKIMADKPLMLAMGNHDTGPTEGKGASYNKIMNFPKNDVTNTQDSYYFRYGNLLVVSLSTSTFESKFNELAKWMSSVFEKNKDAKWKIVFDHHPFYSSAGAGVNAKTGIAHPPNEHGQDPIFIPVFDKYHVDVVVAAHSHYYERFDPSYGFTPKSDNKDIRPNPVDDFSKGTVYMISGGGGAQTFTDTIVNLMCGYGAVKGSKSCNGKNHYVKFTIDNNKLEVEAWRTKKQGNSSDYDSEKLIDSFIITKQNKNCSDDKETSDDSEIQDVDSSEQPDEDKNNLSDELVAVPDENFNDQTSSDNDSLNSTQDKNSKETTDSQNPVESDSGCGCSLL